MDEPRGLSELNDQDRGLALERYHLLQPYLENRLSLSRLAQSYDLPLRTTRRWVAAYRRHGLAGLVRQRRRDQGTHRFPTELLQLVEGLALRRPPPSAATVHRQVTAIARARNWPVPSYSTVYAHIRRLDPGLVSLAHEGSKVYKERYDLLYRREVDRPNAVWLGDHTPLDLVIHDERNTTVKPWLTVILDDYSRAVAGYRLSLRPPSIQQTALTLRQAIWRKGDPHWQVCGIPESFYTDNGSDFISQHMEQVGVDLKMALVFSFPGEPRGRGRIERFFETVNQLFLCQLPGYTPAGTRHVQPTLSFDELDRRLRTFLLEDYHHRVHGETSPDAAFVTVDHAYRLVHEEEERWIYVSEPYPQTGAALEGLAVLAEQGWHVEVRSGLAMHYPGHTLRIGIERAGALTDPAEQTTRGLPRPI